MTVAASQSFALGALDGGPVGFVSPAGDVAVPSLDVHIGWCVVAEHGVCDPAIATTRRQWYDGAVVETAVRVHDGDVVVRAFATRDALVLEFDNATSAACAVGVVVDGDPASVSSRRPAAQWCRAADRDSVVAAIANGATIAGAPEPRTDAGASTGLVWPIAHRATLRVAVGGGPHTTGADSDARSGVVPPDEASVNDVRRAWQVHLRRGLRTEIDDRVLQGAIDAARIGLLVRARASRERPSAPLVTALEDWGFDDEAVAAWDRLGTWDRRASRRRSADPIGAWARVLSAQECRDPVELLNALRALLVSDGSGAVDVLPGFPPAWLGLGVAAHDVAMRGGTVSFALRWHDARPALLWEVTGGLAVRASRLAPGWSTDQAAGEALLPEPPHELFAHAGADPVATLAHCGSDPTPPRHEPPGHDVLGPASFS